MKIKILIPLLLLFVSFVSADLYTLNQEKVYGCSCEILRSSITVQNTGADAIFSTELSGRASEWTTVFPESFELQSGQSKQIQLFSNVPCGLSGKYKLEITITSSESEETITQTFDIDKCNNFKLRFRNLTQQGCACTPFVYDFEVKNTGTYEETFDFELERFSEYATIGVDPLTLGPNSTKDVSIFITPPCDVSGDIENNLHVYSRNSDLHAKAPLTMNVDSCGINQTDGEHVDAEVDYVRILIGGLAVFLLILAIVVVISMAASKDKVYYKSLEKSEKKPGTIILLILMVLVFLSLSFLTYRYVSTVGTNQTQNQTNISVNHTMPDVNLNQTIDMNMTGTAWNGLTDINPWPVIYYSALGFMFFALFVLVVMHIVRAKDKKKAFYRIFKMLTAFVIAVVLIFLFQMEVVTSFLSAYILYVLIGVGILGVLILVLKLKE